MDILGHHQQVLQVLKERFGDKEIVGIEIGTACGDLTKTLLREFPNLKKLYTIDPWTHRDGAEFEASLPQDHHNIAKEHAYNALKEFGDRVVILPMGSDEAVRLMSEYVDFVWIDGDHTGEQVKRDIDNYDPLIRDGGIIGGHDFGQVPHLTEQIKAKYGEEIKSGGDFTWWVYL